MTLVSQDRSLHPELAAALHGYVMDSGRLVVVEVGRDGVILDANVAFRSRFAGFANVRGEPLARFLRSGGQRPDIEPGLPNRQPVARVFKTIMGGESYLFHAYPLGDNALLIGERAGADDNDVIARMGNLTLEMSRLVRDLRKANHDLEQANRLNEQLARTDALTQLPNRRYFMERLSQGVAQAQTRSHPLSVLMMDLDHFKRVNDTFGHAAGDRVLIAFAELMRAQVRVADLPGRLGGRGVRTLHVRCRTRGRPGGGRASARPCQSDAPARSGLPTQRQYRRGGLDARRRHRAVAQACRRWSLSCQGGRAQSGDGGGLRPDLRFRSK